MLRLALFLSALLLPSPASGVVVGARAEWTHTLRTPPPHLSDRAFPAAAAKGGCEVVNSKTALLFIEYQNEFTTPGGKLHEAVKPVMDATQMLPKSAALADAARAAGVKVGYLYSLTHTHLSRMSHPSLPTYISGIV